MQEQNSDISHIKNNLKAYQAFNNSLDNRLTIMETDNKIFHKSLDKIEKNISHMSDKIDEIKERVDIKKGEVELKKKILKFYGFLVSIVISILTAVVANDYLFNHFLKK